MHRSQLWRPLAPLVGAALVVTACSGSGGTSSPDAGGGGSGRLVVAAGPADEGIDGVEAYRVRSSDHTEDPISYDVRPSPGGPHHPVWANCGFYDEPIPDEHLVHDLEHGAVWLAYAPGLPAEDVAVVHDLVRANPKTVAAPHPDLPDGAAVVASAWARQLVLDSVTDPRLEAFVARYQDGSQSPEAGVTCEGTPVGEPIP